jgi:hypothetical protein
MNILKSILAVVVGYLVFAISAFAFIKLSGQPPHEEAPLSFIVGSTVVGMVFALLGGYVAAWLAGRRPLAHALAVAALIALGATASLIATLGKGALWSQVAALVLIAPSTIPGGWLRARQSISA